VKFGVKHHEPPELPSLRLLFGDLKCHSVLICSNRKSKCRCELNGNGKGNEYRNGKGVS